MRVAIFASGNGTNFEVLAKEFEKRNIPGKLVLLFCDHPDAPVVKRALRHDVPVETFTLSSCQDKRDYENKISQVLDKYQVDFIVLAGYMRVIGKELVSAYEHRIINLHPAYLPNYPGLNSIKRAFEAGDRQTGVTIHYVDEGLDSGPIIAQQHVEIKPDDTLAELETRVHQCEHRLYPETLKKLLD